MKITAEPKPAPPRPPTATNAMARANAAPAMAPAASTPTGDTARQPATPPTDMAGSRFRARGAPTVQPRGTPTMTRRLDTAP
jgi:hypothetical protein